MTTQCKVNWTPSRVVYLRAEGKGNILNSVILLFA